MKKSILYLFMLISCLALAQSPKSEKSKYLSIKQKVCPNQKAFQLVLKEVISDSRCPDGLNCIWAGEATAIISVYKDSKLVEENTMNFSMKNQEENKLWFCKYLPEKQRNLKSVSILPYPKEGSKVDPEDYYLKIEYLK